MAIKRNTWLFLSVLPKHCNALVVDLGEVGKLPLEGTVVVSDSGMGVQAVSGYLKPEYTRTAQW